MTSLPPSWTRGRCVPSNIRTEKRDVSVPQLDEVRDEERRPTLKIHQNQTRHSERQGTGDHIERTITRTFDGFNVIPLKNLLC